MRKKLTNKEIVFRMIKQEKQMFSWQIERWAIETRLMMANTALRKCRLLKNEGKIKHPICGDRQSWIINKGGKK